MNLQFLWLGKLRQEDLSLRTALATHSKIPFQVYRRERKNEKEAGVGMNSLVRRGFTGH